MGWFAVSREHDLTTIAAIVLAVLVAALILGYGMLVYLPATPSHV